MNNEVGSGHLAKCYFLPLCGNSLWLLLDPRLEHQRFAQNFFVDIHGKKQPSHQTL